MRWFIVYKTAACLILFLLQIKAFAASFTPTTIAELIASITTANSNAQDDSIDLGGQTFSVWAVNNVSDGQNGLPSIVENGFSLTIRNGVITRSGSTGFRLLHVGANGRLILSNVTLSNGLAEEAGLGIGQGGAIFSRGIILSISDVLFSANQASGANGLLPQASAFGGAIYLAQGSITTIEDSIFEANSATGGVASTILLKAAGGGQGGAIFAAPGTSIGTIDNTIFYGNSARGGSAEVALGFGGDASGGAMYVDSASIATIIFSTFSKNFAQGGASVSSNGGTGRGGGIFLNASGSGDAIMGSLINSTMDQNFATGGIAAILTDGSGLGGALYLNSASGNSSNIASILNTTLSSNNAKNHGGAIDLAGASNISLIASSTIVFNRINDILGGGGLYLHPSSSIGNLVSTIIAENNDGSTYANQDIYLEGSGHILAASYNLIGTDFGHTIVDGANGNQVGTEASPLDPLLDALKENGGPTRTHEPFSWSDAVDHGTDPGTINDQRGAGLFRVIGSQADVGAVELQNCANDSDGDRVCDETDNCNEVANAAQTDADNDGIGDACDNCENNSNADQADTDDDGKGDVCDACENDSLNDIDGDSICGDVDNCPWQENFNQVDTDKDLIGDACDLCTTGNNDEDSDQDGIADACDS